MLPPIKQWPTVRAEVLNAIVKPKPKASAEVEALVSQTAALDELAEDCL